MQYRSIPFFLFLFCSQLSVEMALAMDSFESSGPIRPPHAIGPRSHDMPRENRRRLKCGMRLVVPSPAVAKVREFPEEVVYTAHDFYIVDKHIDGDRWIRFYKTSDGLSDRNQQIVASEARRLLTVMYNSLRYLRDMGFHLLTDLQIAQPEAGSFTLDSFVIIKPAGTSLMTALKNTDPNDQHAVSALQSKLDRLEYNVRSIIDFYKKTLGTRSARKLHEHDSSIGNRRMPLNETTDKAINFTCYYYGLTENDIHYAFYVRPDSIWVKDDGTFVLINVI